MTLQELLQQADPDERDLFLSMARESWDHDMVLLLDAMVEEGLSAWEAAGQVEDESLHGKHRRTLHRTARQIEQELFNRLGRPVAEWVQELLRDGVVIDPPECMLSDLRGAAEDQGMRLVESARYELEPLEGSDDD